MSSTPEPLRFVYGRWRIDTPEVKSCVNIPEVEDGKQFLKMISIAYRKSNRALTYRKSRGVSNEWKWVAWKEKMTTWTFHVLKAWNSYDLSTVVDESTHWKYDGSTSTVTSRSILYGFLFTFLNVLEKRIFFNNQELLWLVIISFILVTLMFDSGVIL